MSGPQTRVRRRRRAAIAAVAITLALPSAAHAATAMPLSIVDEHEPLGPGIELAHQKYLASTGWVDRQVLTVDLANPAVTTDLLHADKVAQGSALTKQANRVGAVAGVNGDFFDIGNSGASLGFEIAGGQLRKSGTRNNGQSVGVTQGGVGKLMNLALAAKATFGGSDRPIAGFNQVGVPDNAIGAYTSDWGEYDRQTNAGGAAGVATTAEVWVADGKVTKAATAPGAGKGTLPDGTTALVGRGSGATALRTLAVGDDVALSYGVSPEMEDRFTFAVGTDAQLVRGGEPVPDAEANAGASGASIAPRTSIGFKDGGKTMILLTVDGPGGTGKGGATLPQVAKMMDDLGAETAVNLDGGGSTTMVGRRLGAFDATVRNVPSDGGERSDPNGVGVFVKPGNGQVEDLVVAPAAGGEPTVFPGMHRAFTATAVDSNQAPVKLDRGDVRWSAAAGSVENGAFQAPADGGRTVTLRATTSSARTDTKVRVLDRLDQLELSSKRLSIPETTSAPTTLTVTGRDAHGFTAPIDASDLELDYDRKVVKVQPQDDALRIVPVAKGATVVSVTAGGTTVQLPTTVGVETKTLHEFDGENEDKDWTANGTSGFAKTLSKAPEGLRLDYKAQRNFGVTRASGASVLNVPGQPLRLRWHVWSEDATEYSNMAWVDASGTRNAKLQSGVKPGWNDLVWTLPSNTKFPIKVTEFQLVETGTARQQDGAFVLDRVEYDAAPEVELPAEAPLHQDPLLSPDGETNGKDDWSFATLSDVQFTAADPTLAKVGVAALKRIRREKPDLVVLNGDITDEGAPEDLTLARKTLEDGGCQLIEAGKEPAADSTPDASSGKVPCYYVPGNHEAYAKAGQGTLDAWKAEFGAPYRTFDHKGTRFILLNSALGSLRGSDFGQLQMFQDALESAKKDDSIDNVMVFAHHPVDDPAETKASQLGDRTEVQLIEELLTDFRQDSDKGAAMAGSHAQILDVHRVEGVPYTVLPSSGKSPYGVPDRGGVTGWLNWHVDRDTDADGQWLTADARAFASQITLNTPASVEVGTSATLSGSLRQPSGVNQNGSRIVPLAYPISVHWQETAELAVGSGDAAIEAARRAGKVAILDPRTRELTGLKRGTVKVAVAEESMREHTDEASLAPVTAEKTIEVVPYAGPGPRFSANVPVFSAQPTGTVSPGQLVTVKNEGDEPLRISDVTIKAADAGSEGDFLLATNACRDAEIAPGASCTVMVRFAPARQKATSKAQLVFATNTAEREHTVALTGESTDLPRGENGTDGLNGADGADGATGPQGPAGATGATGVGAPGLPGPQGIPGLQGQRGEKGARGPKGESARVRVTCKLVNRRRSVRCTVTDVSSRSAAGTKTSKSRVEATVTVAGRSRTVTRTGTVRMTVNAGTRLTTRSRVEVRTSVGGASGKVVVRGAGKRTAALR
ncbi:phosphodiester glycosidase family protein [Patulibacter sp. SYSU D01012]|uniref:phosphodiester glycosidase family protein n=1 Tax=Patulibacter sp. SYSU D01012 TaxID=2817381 RepID=UPI0032C1EC9E